MKRRKPSVAVIGAGFTGLAAGFELASAGFPVTIFESDSEPGGLAVGFRNPDWEWSLERHYHHWFTNDDSILGLARRLDFPVIISRPKTAVLVEDEAFPLDSVSDVRTFPKLSPQQRLHMGLGLAVLRLNPFWRPLERYTAAKILPWLIGNQAYTALWEPLLMGKFGKYAGDVSLAWFWARIVKRTSTLAYPAGGFLAFSQHIVKKITSLGGTVRFKKQVVSLEINNKKVRIKTKPGGTEEYDRAIVTLPMHHFFAIAPQLPDFYKLRHKGLQGLGALNLLLRLKKQFLTDGTYWLNICDTKKQILAIVEHTNFVDSNHYNNEHLVYCSNYLPADHPFYKKTSRELLSIFHPTLKQLHPGYSKNLISIERFTASFAQPVIPIAYDSRIPPVTTPLPNVYLTNMQQIYPWDRGTNYAVALGRKVAGLIVNAV